MVDLAQAWTTCLPTNLAAMKTKSTCRGRALGAVPQDIHEFDYILHENGDGSNWKAPSGANSRRVIKLGDAAEGKNNVIVMASSTAVAEQSSAVAEEGADDMETSQEGAEFDPYAEVDYQQQMGKIQQLQEQRPAMTDRLKQMDLQDIIITLIIPGIVSFVGLRWGFNKVAGRVTEKSDYLLDSFAKEMVFYDGKFDEMRLSVKDYGSKLVWMGPRKNDAMIKRYLQAYAKKKTVSPQSIA